MTYIPEADLRSARGTRAIVHLDALRRNLQRLQRVCSPARVMVVVKANAYGHGVDQVASALDEADCFAVAILAEAARLRRLKPFHRIVLLEGVLNAEELTLADRLNIEIVVHSDFQIRLLREQGFRGRAWLKIDTGMNRLGFPMRQAGQALQALGECVDRDQISLMSHLANADGGMDEKTQQQACSFAELARDFSFPECSLANSAGALLGAPFRYQWVRCGLAVFGGMSSALVSDLEPGMLLESTIIAVRNLEAGHEVGYGSTWVAPEPMRLGVVGIGYGDGYPWRASGASVWLNGGRADVVGRVSMDMITIDLREHDSAQIGDVVELWGSNIPVSEVAQQAGTIPYELLCGVTARVPVEYSEIDRISPATS